MKVTLEFTLPEENYRYYNAMRGEKAIRTLQEVAEELRQLVKYGLPEPGDLPTTLDKLAIIRRSIYEAFPDIDEA